MALTPATQETISLTPLSDDVIEKLKNLPEKFFDYQIVNLVTNTGKIIEKVIILKHAHAMIPTAENILDGSEIVDVFPLV